METNGMLRFAIRNYPAVTETGSGRFADTWRD